MKKKRNRRPGRSRYNRRNIRLIQTFASLLIILAAVIIIGLYLQKKEADSFGEDKIIFDENVSENTIEEPDTPSEVPEEQAEIVYPKPEYEFKTEEVTIAMKEIDREYTIAWVCDLHLVSDHKAGTETGDVRGEYLDAIKKRYENLAVTPEGVPAEELWPEIVKYLNYHEFDGIVFGGDMMDYCSNSNIKMIKEGLDSLRTPYMYVRADHDYGAYYGGIFFDETDARRLHMSIDGDDIFKKRLDMEDYVIVGIDNSTKDMPTHYLELIKEVYAEEKPVIIATHVPYASQVDDSLAQHSMEVRSQIYYWSDDSNHYKPNEVTRKHLENIYSEDTLVRQVLAGHVHAAWDGMISEQVPQHIFTPAFQGSIGIIHIVPDK